MKNFNLKKIVSKNKSGGFALLETLLMLGILVVVTVLTVYTVYAKTSEARHVQIDSTQLASIYAATSNKVALDGQTPFGLNELVAHGAFGSIVKNNKTSDGHPVQAGTQAKDSLVFTIKGAGTDENMKVVAESIKKLHPGASCDVDSNDNNDMTCNFTVSTPAGSAP